MSNWLPARLYPSSCSEHLFPTIPFFSPWIILSGTKGGYLYRKLLSADKPLSTNSLPFFTPSDLPRRGPLPVPAESPAPLRHADQLLQGVSEGGATTAARWRRGGGGVGGRSGFEGQTFWQQSLKNLAENPSRPFHVLDQVFSRTWRLGRSC